MARWTPEEDEILRRMTAEGYSTRQIAERLPGRTRKAILWRRQNKGILAPQNPKQPWGEADDEMLMQLYDLGFFDAKIAQQMGRAIDETAYHRRKLGLPPNKTQHWTDAEKAELKAMFEQGLTRTTMCRRLGKTASAVCRQLQWLGLTVGAKNRADTLCWDCKNAATSGCNWSRSFEPVEGWTAIRSYQSVFSGPVSGWRRVVSYKVLECPEFVEG